MCPKVKASAVHALAHSCKLLPRAAVHSDLSDCVSYKLCSPTTHQGHTHTMVLSMVPSHYTGTACAYSRSAISSRRRPPANHLPKRQVVGNGEFHQIQGTS